MALIFDSFPTGSIGRPQRAPQGIIPTPKEEPTMTIRTDGTTDGRAMRCPECGDTELEKRGNRRCYAPLVDERGEIDGWNEGDIDWDGDERGNEVIYCTACDNEFVQEEG